MDFLPIIEVTDKNELVTPPPRHDTFIQTNAKIHLCKDTPMSITQYLVLNSGDRCIDLVSKSAYLINIPEFKNICSIHLDKVIAPIESLTCPYFSLQIEELGSNCDGSNEAIKKTFSHLVHDSTFQTSNGRLFCIFKSFHGEKKEYPIPIPYIQNNCLTISFHKPNGTPCTNIGLDAHAIQCVESGKSENLTVTLCDEFSSVEFMTGDTIKIKNFNIAKLVGSQAQNHVDAFNEFLNRDAGHEVLSILSPLKLSISLPQIHVNLKMCLDLFNLNKKAHDAPGYIIN